MIACKQVAKALEKGDYEKLPPISKYFLKLHVKLCTMCGGYHEHVMTMQDTAREFNAHEEVLPPRENDKLSVEASERMRQALRAARDKAE